MDVPTLVAEVRRFQDVIVNMWESGAISDGQAARMLGVSRLDAREIRVR